MHAFQFFLCYVLHVARGSFLFPVLRRGSPFCCVTYRVDALLRFVLSRCARCRCSVRFTSCVAFVFTCSFVTFVTRYVSDRVYRAFTYGLPYVDFARILRFAFPHFVVMIYDLSMRLPFACTVFFRSRIWLRVLRLPLLRVCRLQHLLPARLVTPRGFLPRASRSTRPLHSSLHAFGLNAGCGYVLPRSFQFTAFCFAARLLRFVLSAAFALRPFHAALPGSGQFTRCTF